MKTNIKPADGKLGILIPGLGAVATTMIAGVEAVKKGIAQPIGSLTQMGNIRLGKRTENRFPKVKDFVPLADLNDIVFGGWDVYSDNVYEAAMKAKVLEPSLLNQVKAELESVVPMKAAFDKNYAKNLIGTNIKGGTRYEMAQAVMDDITSFKEKNNCDRIVLIW
jgi:myo-inositol-1-phosphate synthase